MTRTTSIKQIVMLGFALFVLVGYQYTAANWSEPSQTPTGGNVAAPINVGPTAQTKSGRLTVQNNLYNVRTISSNRMLSPRYCDENNNNCFDPSEVSGSAGSFEVSIRDSCNTITSSASEDPSTCSMTCSSGWELLNCTSEGSHTGDPILDYSTNSCTGSSGGSNVNSNAVHELVCARMN